MLMELILIQQLWINIFGTNFTDKRNIYHRELTKYICDKINFLIDRIHITRDSSFIDKLINEIEWKWLEASQDITTRKGFIDISQNPSKAINYIDEKNDCIARSVKEVIRDVEEKCIEGNIIYDAQKNVNSAQIINIKSSFIPTFILSYFIKLINFLEIRVHIMGESAPNTFNNFLNVMPTNEEERLFEHY